MSAGGGEEAGRTVGRGGAGGCKLADGLGGIYPHGREKGSPSCLVTSRSVDQSMRVCGGVGGGGALWKTQADVSSSPAHHFRGQNSRSDSSSYSTEV